MQEGNYIKLYRSFLEWEWYSDINTARLFIHMILRANWKDGKFQGTTVPRGSYISSVRKLSEETGLTEREIRTAIVHLKSTGELTNKTTNKYSVFTVVNYDSYQSNDTQNVSQEPSSRQPNDNLTTTIEEGKKERREESNKKDKCMDANKLFESLWELYPVKKGKGRVSDADRMKLLVYGHEEVARAIERYRGYVDSIDYLSYQNGNTFFHSGYVDYLDANYTAGPSTKKKRGSNKFNDMMENTYDFEKLEKELTGY